MGAHIHKYLRGNPAVYSGVVGVTRDKYFRSNRMDARSPSLTCHHRLIKNNSVSRAQESFSTSRGTAGTAGAWHGDLVGWSCLTAAVVVQMKREMGAEKHCTVSEFKKCKRTRHRIITQRPVATTHMRATESTACSRSSAVSIH